MTPFMVTISLNVTTFFMVTKICWVVKKSWPFMITNKQYVMIFVMVTKIKEIYK